MFNKFAAGRKVYGQGSFAPNKGQVNPQGYIQREIRKRNQQAQAKNGGVSQFGNDGQSDTRAGLAAGALRNNAMAWVQKNGPRQAVAKGPNQPGHGWGPQAVAVGPNDQGARGNQGPRGNQTPDRGRGTQGPVNTGPSTEPPAVNISPAGTLELPYNSEYARQALDAQMAFDADMLELQQDEQNQSLEFQRNMRDLDQGYEGQQRNTLNENAGRGTAFSSAYGVGVNEDARTFNNMKNDLTAQDSLFKSQTLTRRQQAQQALNQMLQMITQGYADSLADEAGSLGFGVSDEAPVDQRGPQGNGQPNKPKPKPKHKQPDKPKAPPNHPHGGWHGPGNPGKDRDDKGKKGKKK